MYIRITTEVFQDVEDEHGTIIVHGIGDLTWCNGIKDALLFLNAQLQQIPELKDESFWIK